MTWREKTAKKRKTNPFIAHRKMMVQIEKWKEIQSTIDYENQICFMRWIENAFSGNNVQTESNSGKRKMMKTHGIWNSIYRFYRIFHRNNNPTAYIHTEQLKHGMETTTNVMEFIDTVVSSRIQEDSEKYILRRANKTFAKANNRIVMQRRLPKYLHTCEMQRVRLLKINGLMSHQYTWSLF